MSSPKRLLCLFSSLAAAWIVIVAAAPSEGVLGAGTSYVTPYYVLRGKAPGPVILVQAGIHGNEVAGIYALDEIQKKIVIQNGNVIFIPRLNSPAVAKSARFINYDLNRVFANADRKDFYEFALAREVTELVAREKVQYVLTLHEARRVRDGGKSGDLGQTICYGIKPAPPVLKDWLSRLNGKITAVPERFIGTYFPIPTSSTEVLVAKFRLKGGFCVETWSGLPLPRRIAYHRSAIETFLTSVGVGYRYRSSHAATEKLPTAPTHP